MSTPAAQSSSNRSTPRADIQSNLLADKIERWFIQIKPFLPWILGGIAAVVLAAIIISLISGQAAKREAIGWSDIYFSQAAAPQLEAVSEDFEGTSASLWAKQLAADAKLNESLLQVYLDREIALQKIKEARGDYEAVAGNSRDPMLTIRANLGLAKTYDAEANADAAVKAYQTIISMPEADEQLKKSLAERIAFIQSDRGKEFYAWFKENAPADPRPTGADKDLNKLPESPDIKFSVPESPLGTSTGELPPATGDISLPDASATSETPNEPAPSSIQLPTETQSETPAADAATGTDNATPSQQLEATTGTEPAATESTSATSDQPTPAETKE